MTADIIIDDDGEPWPIDAPELARRLGCRDLRFGLADFAVAERGFIHIRPIETGVRVALRPGAFSPVTLAGTLQGLNDLSPRRILLVVGSGRDRMAELFTSIFEFVERAEHLASDPAIEVRVPHLSVPRGIHNLATAPFAVVRPIVEFWRQRRGELTEDVHSVIIQDQAYRRAVLARRIKGTSRFIVEYLGAGHQHLRPCESLSTIGRDVQEQPDRQYGAWIAQAYDEASRSHRLRVDSIRAQVGTSAAILLRARYDRVLMPWRKCDDVFVMAVSIRRELSVMA